MKTGILLNKDDQLHFDIKNSLMSGWIKEYILNSYECSIEQQTTLNTKQVMKQWHNLRTYI